MLPTFWISLVPTVTENIIKRHQNPDNYTSACSWMCQSLSKFYSSLDVPLKVHFMLTRPSIQNNHILVTQHIVPIEAGSGFTALFRPGRLYSRVLSYVSSELMASLSALECKLWTVCFPSSPFAYEHPNWMSSLSYWATLSGRQYAKKMPGEACQMNAGHRSGWIAQPPERWLKTMQLIVH